MGSMSVQFYFNLLELIYIRLVSIHLQSHESLQDSDDYHKVGLLKQQTYPQIIIINTGISKYKQK